MGCMIASKVYNMFNVTKIYLLIEILATVLFIWVASKHFVFQKNAFLSLHRMKFVKQTNMF